MKDRDIPYQKPKSLLRYGQEFYNRCLGNLSPARKSSALLCQRCGAKKVNGRWSWGGVSLFLKKGLCPACKRIEEDRPAGILTLDGERYRDHLLEITAMVKHLEIVEKGDHPLSRLIDCSVQGNTVSIRTTSTHLVKSISEMVQRSFGATKVTYHYDESKTLIVELTG